MIKPAERTVLIEPYKIKKGGLIDPISDNKQETGKVIAVGSKGGEEDRFPISMRKGLIVVYRKFGEDKIYFEGREYLFVKFEDILGVIQ